MKFTETQKFILAVVITLCLPAAFYFYLAGVNHVLVFVLLASLGVLLGFLSWNQGGVKSNAQSSAQPRNVPLLAVRLLKLAISSSKEQDNIIGDLLEEFLQFDSKLQAYFWLYKQVLKSVAPLILKTSKSRLAPYFGERELFDKELKRAVQDIYAKLPTYDRKLLMLKYNSEMTDAEIGHIFDISETMARRRRIWALEQFREMFIRKYGPIN